MEFARCALLLTILAFYVSIIKAEASMRKARWSPGQSSQARHVPAAIANVSDEVQISPELEPESDHVFMKKDLPDDKRPVANPFHFKHPYPVVQDSGDFDKDFVKDENSDNGNWKAQETYDRLRSKLAKEKRDLAAALAKKEAEEQELEEAKKSHEEAAEKKVAAHKKADRLRKERRERRNMPDPISPKGKEGTAGEAPPAPRHRSGSASGSGESKMAKAEEADEEVEDATEETKDAVDKLEDCKKQLAEARKRLKEVMKELEEAKAAQQKAGSAADDAAKKELEADQKKEGLHQKVDDAHAAYEDAKKKHDKAKAELAEYEAQLNSASEKVKDMRRAEDKDGGVYPKHVKSNALTDASPRFLMLAMFVGLIASGL